MHRWKKWRTALHFRNGGCRQNFSASILVSKQINCSISLSKNPFKRVMAVDTMLAPPCSLVLADEPANHLALCSYGSMASRALTCISFLLLSACAESSWISL